MRLSILIVDDEAPARRRMRDLLSDLAPELPLNVVGEAGNGLEALEQVRSLAPNLVLADMQMPRMDGLTFLRRLMASYPLPVVVVSSLTERGGALALEALDAGAVDVMCKPGPAYTVGDMVVELTEKVKGAARARLKAKLGRAQSGIDPETLMDGITLAGYHV